jgi:hypothetical protein
MIEAVNYPFKARPHISVGLRVAVAKICLPNRQDRLTFNRAERATNATVLFPVVALSLSTVFEGSRWTLSARIGIGIILTGNLLVLK